MGLRGDLTAGEIVEQIVHAKRHVSAIRNVVFMVSKSQSQGLTRLVGFRAQIMCPVKYRGLSFLRCDPTHMVGDPTHMVGGMFLNECPRHSPTLRAWVSH